MNTDMDILNGTDDFPYPISINRTDFQKFNQSEIDQFLYSNHRFTLIDLLIKELTKLSDDLNQNLLDLVNTDYGDFIELGKSINGGLDLINLILGDLKNFRLDLINYHTKFGDSYELIDSSLAVRQELIRLKTLAKVNLLLNDQVTNFENALTVEDAEQPVLAAGYAKVIHKLKSLTGWYLSISNLYHFLVSQDTPKPSEATVKNGANSDNSSINGNNTRRASLLAISTTSTGNQFIENYLNNKISSLKFEFKSYLDDVLTTAIRNKKDREVNELILELLNVYKVIGHEEDLLTIVKRNTN